VLDDYLRRQDGVLTHRQALRTGLSQDAINRRLRSGAWLRCSRGVYFVDDRPFIDQARVRAGVWSYGQDAVASGLAAAWWHGVTQFPPDIVEVTVPRAARLQRTPGTRLRRRDLASRDAAAPS
jgi:hypothetical protein